LIIATDNRAKIASMIAKDDIIAKDDNIDFPPIL